VKIYLVTEILPREIIGNLLLASLLASRGHFAIILNQEDAFVLSSKSVSGTTIFHTKSIHYAPERVLQHKKLRDQGFLITSQDQETFSVVRDVAARVSERFCEENLHLVDRCFVWSEFEAAEISRQFPKHASKIAVTGSPREDIWGKRFRSLAGNQSSGRKCILIVSNNDGMNHRLRHWEQMLMIKSVIGSETDPAVFDHYVEDVVDGLRSQLRLSRVALKLADEFRDCKVVIQPKKNEIVDSWWQTLQAVDKGNGTRANLFIDNSKFLEESIHGSDVVINSNSTAGLTALLGSVPLISLGPTFSFIGEIGLQLEREEDVVSAVGQALDDPKGFISQYEALSRSKLGGRVRHPSATMAADEIVKELESLDSKNARSRLTYRDALLYFAPGSFRRLAYAIKSLMNLKPPVRPHSEMLTTISQSRVNELLAHVYSGLGTDLGVKASVRGRRNIVVRPRYVP